MFSGLVRYIAQVKSFRNNTLEILTSYNQVHIGDSIAINGACLTAIRVFQGGMVMELSTHTQKHIATENYAQGAFVHLEPALQVGDRFDGHIVQGHIDGIGRITDIKHHRDSSDFWIESSKEVLSYIISKGSICIEGISLTVVESTKDAFKLTLIPHTLQNTLFGKFHIGRRVNLETDIITRSVVSTLRTIMQNKPDSFSWSEIDMASLSY